MKNFRISRITTVVLVTVGLLLAAATASASKQAVVEIKVLNQFVNGTTFTQRSATWTKSGSVLVTVDTPGATPSIMWPANIISGTENYTYSAPFPEHNMILAACWACDDFTKEGGATFVIPGTKVLRRHPREGEIANLSRAIAIE